MLKYCYVGLDSIIIINNIYEQMSGNLKTVNQKQIKSPSKPMGQNFCGPALAKTQSAPFQQPNKIQTSKITESIVVLNNKKGYSLCTACSQGRGNPEQLKFLKDQISYLKEKNFELKQDIELLTTNFMYIIELASDNIMNGVKSRIKNILKAKQNLIEKQAKIIKNLQSQSEILIDKVDQNMEISTKIEQLEQKIRILEVENKTLKEQKVKKMNSECESVSSFVVGSTQMYTLGSESPKDFPLDFGFGSLQIPCQQVQFAPKSSHRIEKRRTMDIEKEELQRMENNKIKSLNNLKTKINLIKEKLINEKH